MTCPGCHSFEMDAVAHCDGCGLQLSVAQEQALKAALPPLRTRAIEDDRLDFAIREAA